MAGERIQQFPQPNYNLYSPVTGEAYSPEFLEKFNDRLPEIQHLACYERYKDTGIFELTFEYATLGHEIRKDGKDNWIHSAEVVNTLVCNLKGNDPGCGEDEKILYGCYPDETPLVVHPAFQLAGLLHDQVEKREHRLAKGIPNKPALEINRKFVSGFMNIWANVYESESDPEFNEDQEHKPRSMELLYALGLAMSKHYVESDMEQVRKDLRKAINVSNAPEEDYFFSQFIAIAKKANAMADTSPENRVDANMIMKAISKAFLKGEADVFEDMLGFRAPQLPPEVGNKELTETEIEAHPLLFAEMILNLISPNQDRPASAFRDAEQINYWSMILEWAGFHQLADLAKSTAFLYLNSRVMIPGTDIPLNEASIDKYNTAVEFIKENQWLLPDIREKLLASLDRFGITEVEWMGTRAKSPGGISEKSLERGSPDAAAAMLRVDCFPNSVDDLVDMSLDICNAVIGPWQCVPGVERGIRIDPKDKGPDFEIEIRLGNFGEEVREVQFGKRMIKVKIGPATLNGYGGININMVSLEHPGLGVELQIKDGPAMTKARPDLLNDGTGSNNESPVREHLNLDTIEEIIALNQEWDPRYGFGTLVHDATVASHPFYKATIGKGAIAMLYSKVEAAYKNRRKDPKAFEIALNTFRSYKLQAYHEFATRVLPRLHALSDGVIGLTEGTVGKMFEHLNKIGYGKMVDIIKSDHFLMNDLTAGETMRYYFQNPDEFQQDEGPEQSWQEP